ncbi:hypothetical protein KFL_009610015 [Klebsormidium nitens]|uniref:Integrase catalytic domain-containing protein n=1 Tax=Klebsormidium nitens TaxID=105231 RepID=A0A1Y1ITW8_KLENI|nr:hypothetical protein KFL_009610015 [Klebsormidium nitens]|eukprot:GAQ92266.1 hypothetical protein KFL_009610015 [Klebsormidium nitens]
MKRKSDVTADTESVFARLKLQSGKKVKSVQTDRGGEYVNEGMTALLGKRGTVQRTTAGHSPKQNGLAKRLNRTLEERAHALLEDAGLNPEVWAEAMVTANYTRNRLRARAWTARPRAISTRKAGTQPGARAIPTGKAGTEREEANYPQSGSEESGLPRGDTEYPADDETADYA